MKTTLGETTAENLEARFEAGEDVLDYFDLDRARIAEGDAPHTSFDKPKAPPPTSAQRAKTRNSK
jgi:hypothetical protein